MKRDPFFEAQVRMMAIEWREILPGFGSSWEDEGRPAVDGFIEVHLN